LSVTVSVVLINSGRDEDLLTCVRYLARYDWADVKQEVIVVAHQTSDEVRREALTSGRELKWLNVDRFGVARMRNAGARLATGSHLLFLDTDTCVEPGAIQQLLAGASRIDDAAAVAPQLLSPDGSLQFSCRRFYTPWTGILRRLPFADSRSKAVRRHLMADWDHSSEATVDWVVGACMLVPRRAYADVGAFPETTEFGFEDVEWCWRARMRGWRIIYDGKAVVFHAYVRSSYGLNRRSMSHAFAYAAFLVRTTFRRRRR